jgi:hypothetical protein
MSLNEQEKANGIAGAGYQVMSNIKGGMKNVPP